MAAIDRQEGIELGLIEKSHRYRYEFFCQQMSPGARVLNVACGVGYGSSMIQEAGGIVTSVDIDNPSIRKGMEYYSSDIWICGDIEDCPLGTYDWIVAFEILEHLQDPLPVLKRLIRHKHPLGYLVASVPNEDVVHFDPKDFSDHDYPHYRHYTRNEFVNLLRDAGFDEFNLFGQHKKRMPDKEMNGFTLMAICR